MAQDNRTLRAVPQILRIPVEVLDREKDDGSTTVKTFTVYVKGPGCPVPVVIETNEIWAEYSENFPTPELQKDMKPARRAAATQRCELILRRDLLVAVSIGMDIEDANFLAADKSDGLIILHRSKWYIDFDLDDDGNPKVEEEEEDNDTGEVKDGTGE